MYLYIREDKATEKEQKEGEEGKGETEKKDLRPV